MANITLYGAGSNLSDFTEKLMDIFGRNAKRVDKTEEDQYQLTLIDDSLITFYITTSPSEVVNHTMGMANFFSQAQLENQQVKNASIQQIQLFSCIIGVTFELNEDDNRTSFIIGAMQALGKEITAFILFPSMQLYHPEGKLLISIDGETEFEEYYAIMLSESVIPSEEETENDRKRKERSIAILEQKGIPYAAHMKVSAFDAKSVIPNKEDIIHRAIAVFAACVKSEVYTCGRYENPVEKVEEQLNMLDEAYDVSDYFSAEEKRYMDKADPDAATLNKFGWRYECCAVLMWALSLVEMKEPTEICSAAELGGIIWNHDFDSLMKKAVLRDREEILDMQDLVHRYDWACIEARIKKMELPMLNEEIVCEWHYALNWLTGVDGVTDWDEVPRRA